MRHQDFNIIFQPPKEATSGFVIKKCRFKSRPYGTHIKSRQNYLHDLVPNMSGEILASFTSLPWREGLLLTACACATLLDICSRKMSYNTEFITKIFWQSIESITQSEEGLLLTACACATLLDIFSRKMSYNTEFITKIFWQSIESHRDGPLAGTLLASFTSLPWREGLLLTACACATLLDICSRKMSYNTEFITKIFWQSIESHRDGPLAGTLLASFTSLPWREGLLLTACACATLLDICSRKMSYNTEFITKIFWQSIESHRDGPLAGTLLASFTSLPWREGLLLTACACATLLDIFPVKCPIILNLSRKYSEKYWKSY